MLRIFMKLSVLVPVYNEVNTIEEVISRLRQVPLEKEIIVIDGNSDDGTSEILKRCEKNGLIKLVFEEERKGRGNAVINGLEYVEGDVVVMQDGDLELSPDELPQMFKLIVEGKYNVVFGSRFLKKQKCSTRSIQFANVLLTFIVNVLLGSRLTDVLTCYKMMTIDIAKELNLESKGFDLETEIVVKLLKKRILIGEVPVTYTPRNFEEGKKIKWSDGWKILKAIFKFKFVNN